MPWKILLLEDSATAASVMVLELEGCGIECECRRATTRPEFMDLLKANDLDLVLADQQLIDFTGVEALTIIRERSRNIPFIFVTGTLTENAARVLLANGATDFVLKADLGRLGPAVKNALRGRVAKDGTQSS